MVQAHARQPGKAAPADTSAGANILSAAQQTDVLVGLSQDRFGNFSSTVGAITENAVNFSRISQQTVHLNRNRRYHLN